VNGYLWSKSAGDGKLQKGTGIATDSTGNVLVTGYFNGSMDLGGCPLTSAGGNDLFVVKLDPLGACLWSKGAGDDAYQGGTGIATDSTGNVLVTGSFDGLMDLGGCPLTSAGGNDLFVVKLDPSGACLWSKGAGDDAYQGGTGIATDSTGNVLVTGTFSSTLSIPGCPLAHLSGNDMFVAKLSSSGTCSWSRNGGNDANLKFGTFVAADSTGNILVTGSFAGTLNLGKGVLASAGSTDFYLAKFDAAGGLSWSRRAGSSSQDIANGVAVDSMGNGLVIGSFRGTADFEPIPLVNGGGDDVFVAKFAP
jgi:hypothetical protein